MSEHILLVVYIFLVIIVPTLILFRSEKGENIDNLLKYLACWTMVLVCIACVVYLFNNTIFWGAVLGGQR